MSAFVLHLPVERPRRHWLRLPPAPPVSSRGSASAVTSRPASPGSPFEATEDGGRCGRPRRAGRHFHRERVPPPRRPCSPSSPTLIPTGELAPPPPPAHTGPPAFPTLSASWRRQNSPSGERREGDPAATDPKMAAAERREERASGWRARRPPFLPEGDSPGGQPTPRSLTGSRAPRPSPDSALGTYRPNLPPSTSDTLWGASNADSDGRGGRAGTAASSAGGAPDNGLSLPTVRGGDDRVGSCAAQTLARGGWEGASEEEGAGRGGAHGPAAPLSRDSTDRPVSAGAGRSAPAH